MSQNIRSVAPDFVPTREPARREWIKFQLRLKGLSMASLGRRHNKNRRTIQKALDTTWSTASEQIIADALRIKAAHLWPERYDERGRRIKKKRGPKPGRKNRGRVQ